MTWGVEGLGVSFGRNVALDGVTLEVPAGQVTAVVGGDGAGKTTLLRVLAGLVLPSRGTARLPERERMGYLPARAGGFRDLTVEENILAVLEFQSWTRAERRERLERLLEEMGLTRVRASRGRVLSGGERRRLEIACALAIEPRFLLLDEPFAGIDPKQVEDLQEMVLRLKRSGIGVLITDHNVHEMLDVVDTATIIFQGRVLKSGKSRDLVNDPEVREHYLGEKFRWHETVEGTF